MDWVLWTATTAIDKAASRHSVPTSRLSECDASASYRRPLLSLRCFAGGQIYLDVPPRHGSRGGEGSGAGAPPTAPPPHI